MTYRLFKGAIAALTLTACSTLGSPEDLDDLNDPTVSMSTMEQEMLAAHNDWRSQVEVPPLQWSAELADYAQAWANELSDRNAFEHRSNNSYGENLFTGSGRQWSPTEVVNAWGSEVEDYNYATNQCSGVCGHYTQMVWRDTTQVGCGVARTADREVWVCNYNPPGNYVGEKPY